MKRVIKASELHSYTVTVNFAGYMGADNDYDVNEANEDDAISAALEQARDDLSVEDIEEVDEGEYEVHVGFCGYIGVEEVYTVTADSEDEASDDALDYAYDDLSAEISYSEED